MKRILLIFLLVLCSSAVVFSGGSAETGGESKEFEFWCYWDKGHPNDIWMRAIVSDFEKETGIKVNYTNPGRNILLGLRPAIVAGNPPDLIDGHAIEMYPSLIEDGLMMSLEDVYGSKDWTGTETFEKLFMEGTTNQAVYEGKRCFVPYCAHTSCIHYNVTEFNKRGFKIPKTWSEFTAICDKLVAEGMAPVALDNLSLYNAYWFYWFVNRISGANAFYEAAMDPTGKKWDNPEFLQAAKLVQEVSSKYFIEGWQGNIWPAGQIDWAQGQAFFHLDGSYIANELFDKVDDDFEFGAFPFPMVDGGKGDYSSKEISVMGFGIPADAKHPDLAKQFIKFALQKKYQIQLMETYYPTTLKNMDGYIPAEIKDVYKIMTDSGPIHKLYDGLQEKGEWWSLVFYPLDDKLIKGEIDAQAFIKGLKEASIKYHQK